MNEISSRLKEVREALGMNQTQFGARLGIGNTAICKAEIGENNVSERVILDVCRVFSISEDWLRTGNGEMEKDNTIIKNPLILEMADTYELDELDIAYIEIYVTLPPAIRKVVKNHLTQAVSLDKLTVKDLEEAYQPAKE